MGDFLLEMWFICPFIVVVKYSIAIDVYKPCNADYFNSKTTLTTIGPITGGCRWQVTQLLVPPLVRVGGW